MCFSLRFFNSHFKFMISDNASFNIFQEEKKGSFFHDSKTIANKIKYQKFTHEWTVRFFFSFVVCSLAVFLSPAEIQFNAMINGNKTVEIIKQVNSELFWELALALHQN